MSGVAPSWGTLYDHERWIEGAAKVILQTGTITTNVYTARDEGELKTPRVSLQLRVGGALEHYGVRASDGQAFNNAWQGVLEARVVTKRQVNEASHGTVRSAVRQYLSQWKRFNTQAELPYHEVTKVMEAQTDPNVFQDLDTDTSSVKFDIVWCIQNGAWPATDPLST